MLRTRLPLLLKLNSIRIACLLNGLAAVGCFVGCDKPLDSFKSNALHLAKLEKSQGVDLSRAADESSAALESLFGTPEKPLWPEFLQNDAFAGLVSAERLQQAAGAVRSDEQDRHFGLFREHCVACHGVAGDGAGPASRLLSPYPRDFRLGKFKFKSTPIGKKPTRADLRHVLTAGLPGTSMPSFRLLNDEELDALVDYVIYLSVRGEVERQLLTEAAMEIDFEAGERLYDVSLRESKPDEFAAQSSLLTKVTETVAKQWVAADEAVTQVPTPTKVMFEPGQSLNADDQVAMAESIANGRKLFLGPIANCASCHGATAMGDGQTKNYDAWTKDWLEGLDPQNRDEIKPMLRLGALKPQYILPRNLRTGVYRGGSAPADLYLRIVNGIDGTPMPATAMQPANPQGLTESDVWDLVNFLLSLPHEAISAEAGITPPQSVSQPTTQATMQTPATTEAT